VIDVLFGSHRSWQRRVCIALSGVLVVFGAVIAVADDVVQGLLIVLVGLLSGAVLARVAEESASRAATSELLGDIRRMSGPGSAPTGAARPADEDAAGSHPEA
jgi:hypothetical protein